MESVLKTKPAISTSTISGPTTDAIIDLSHWQPTPNWDKVRRNGIQAVMLKSSQGISSDPTFHARATAAHNAGLLVGAYHFGVRSVDAVKQAEYFLSLVKSLGASYIPAVLALDFEWNKADTMTTDQARIFVERIYDVKVSWPLLYTSAAFLDEVDEDGITRFIPCKDDPLLNCDLWLAGMTKAPRLPFYFSDWCIWQYDIGTCDGVSGQVDRNIFHGSPEDLAEYFS